jgi:hypothetical protein
MHIDEFMKILFDGARVEFADLSFDISGDAGIVEMPDSAEGMLSYDQITVRAYLSGTEKVPQTCLATTYFNISDITLDNMSHEFANIIGENILFAMETFLRTLIFNRTAN